MGRIPAYSLDSSFSASLSSPPSPSTPSTPALAVDDLLGEEKDTFRREKPSESQEQNYEAEGQEEEVEQREIKRDIKGKSFQQRQSQRKSLEDSKKKSVRIASPEASIKYIDR